jgi:putative flavoprotein involved in K+ transport
VEGLDLVVIGAGSAGLATAALLRREGFPPVVLEAGPEPGAAWRERYDRLRLHTPRLLSGLPGLRIPRRYGRWVRRDDLLAYFTDYADSHDLDVRTGVRVRRIDPGWELDTSAGPIRATTVIVATGYNGAPFIPDWPGRDGFAGDLIHSSDYRNPEPFRGQDVLVVGAGNSGAEIATDVADGGASHSRLSVRTPPQIVRRATAGIPAQLIGIAIRHLPPHWVDPISMTQRRLSIPDLAAQGLPRPEHGIRTSFITTGTTPILDVGIVDAVRRGRVEIVAAVERFDGGAVMLADGSRVSPDAIIAATGFRAGLDALVGHLGVLGRRGLPAKTDGEPVLPGLWFVGFTPTLGGQLREGSIAARKVAAAVTASLR